MTNFDSYLTADARLVILRELAKQTDGRLNETLIVVALDTFGHNRSREWVRTQLHKLEELGAVRLTSIDRPEVAPILVAALTTAGLDHVERRSVIDGIARPSPGL